MGGGVLVRRHAQGFTRFHVETGSMARAFDFTTVNWPIAQRAAVVGADIVNTIIVFAVAKKYHNSIVCLHNGCLAWFQIAGDSHLGEFAHEGSY